MASKRTPETRSDEILVDACNHGDAREATDAFEALYERHKGYVIRVALRFVPDNDAALDVLQETFSYLLGKFPPLGNGLTLTSRLTSLLYPVAKNSAITLRRKSERLQQSGDTAPDDLPASDPRVNEVDALFRDLTEEHREILTLRFVDDLALQDIAETLDLPLGTVKSRLHLAIRRLRELPSTKEFFDR